MDSIWDKLPEGTATEVIEHYLPQDEHNCPKCGAEMEIIGKKEYKSLVIIPAQYMEQEFHRQGLELSRQTMANWLLDSADLWLKPIYECLHKKLLTHEVLHADETTLQVLHEEGRRPQSKSYMWVYRTSGDAEHPIVLYKYEQGRSGRYSEEFLQGFKGYLHSDGYSAYHNLGSDVINVGCLVHARRKFHDVIKLNKKDGANQSAAKAVGYFSKIFKLENALAKKSVEEHYAKRLELEKPILDELFAWAEKLYVTPKSKLGEAVTYLRNQSWMEGWKQAITGPSAQ